MVENIEPRRQYEIELNDFNENEKQQEEKQKLIKLFKDIVAYRKLNRDGDIDLKDIDKYLGSLNLDVKSFLDAKKLFNQINYSDAVKIQKAFEKDGHLDIQKGYVHDLLNKMNLVKDEKIIEITPEISPVIEILDFQNLQRSFMPENEETKLKDKEAIDKIVEKNPENIPEDHKEEYYQSKYYGKKYYLSGEAMKESFCRMIDQKVGIIANLPEEYHEKIKAAYLTCSDPNDLVDPDFLEDRIGKIIRETKSYETSPLAPLEMSALHKAIMGYTYIGYHMGEAIGNEINSDVAIVSFPSLVDELPSILKDEEKENAIQSITSIIQEYYNRVKDSKSMEKVYKVLMILDCPEGLVDEAIDKEDYKGLDDSEAASLKVYILQSKDELKDKTKDITDDFVPLLEEKIDKGYVKDPEYIDIAAKAARDIAVAGITIAKNPNMLGVGEALARVVASHIDPEYTKDVLPPSGAEIVGNLVENAARYGMKKFEEMKQDFDEEIENSENEFEPDRNEI